MKTKLRGGPNKNAKSKKELAAENKLKFFVCSTAFSGTDGFKLPTINDLYEDVIFRDEEPCAEFDEKFKYECEATTLHVNVTLGIGRELKLAKEQDKEEDKNTPSTSSACSESPARSPCRTKVVKRPQYQNRILSQRNNILVRREFQPAVTFRNHPYATPIYPRSGPSTPNQNRFAMDQFPVTCNDLKELQRILVLGNRFAVPAVAMPNQNIAEQVMGSVNETNQSTNAVDVHGVDILQKQMNVYSQTEGNILELKSTPRFTSAAEHVMVPVNELNQTVFPQKQKQINLYSQTECNIELKVTETISSEASRIIDTGSREGIPDLNLCHRGELPDMTPLSRLECGHSEEAVDSGPTTTNLSMQTENIDNGEVPYCHNEVNGPSITTF